MLRFTPCMRIGTFSMFMIQEKKNPILTALPISQRGKKLGEMYRALTPKEIEKLTLKAKKYKPSPASLRRKALRLKRRSQHTTYLKIRGAKEYNRFLKGMYERYAKMPESERFDALVQRFERTYGKPLPVLKKKKATKPSASPAVTKKSMKKAIKKAAKPSASKAKSAAPKVKKAKKTQKPKVAKKK